MKIIIIMKKTFKQNQFLLKVMEYALKKSNKTVCIFDSIIIHWTIILFKGLSGRPSIPVIHHLLLENVDISAKQLLG